MPNIGGQMTNQQVAALEGLVGLIRMREATNPFPAAAQPAAPAGAPASGAQPTRWTAQQAQAIRDLGDLIQARAAQVQANPELAGRVVPSAFNQGLQQIAGPDGERLTNTDLLGVPNLFGGTMLQRNWTIQQLEDIIRERAVGADLMAQLGTQHSDQGSQQGAGVDPQPQGTPQRIPPRGRR